jgi:hypothetical protein
MDAALTDLDRNEAGGALVRATGMRIRFELPDISAVLNIAARSESGQNITWAFADAGEWSPKLQMKMDSAVANRFLQGRESLAIAVARGRVHCEGESRYTLLYVPALKLFVDPYRRAVRELHKELALD